MRGITRGGVSSLPHPPQPTSPLRLTENEDGALAQHLPGEARQKPARNLLEADKKKEIGGRGKNAVSPRSDNLSCLSNSSPNPQRRCLQGGQ